MIPRPAKTTSSRSTIYYMTNPKLSIKIDHVTKQYRIYSSPLERFRDALGWRADFKEFLALSDVSLNIHEGEFWGIVGRNGSGKSTLLKIVAGQLQATTGSASCFGRVALLQLGLGFDPELTGLDNIKHSRLLQNLSSDYDDVVEFVKEFSELGDFIKYPVKTYSSGMHSRLAFATAIAGDPDILIADEVLAVGDMNFSQKCLAKMREFKEKGKTIVLVTHDINAVKSFCDQAVWLNDGKAMLVGPAKMVAEDFRNFMLYGVTSSLSEQGGLSEEGATAEDLKQRWTTPNKARRTIWTSKTEIIDYRFSDPYSGDTLVSLRPGQTIEFQIRFSFVEACEISSFGFTWNDRNGMIAVHLNSNFFGGEAFAGSVGDKMTARMTFDVPFLASGDYSLSMGLSDHSGELIEKYDFDSIMEITHPPTQATEKQGGYVIIPEGKFMVDQDA